MTAMLRSRSVASLTIAGLVLALVAGLALAVSHDESSLVLNTAAQEDQEENSADGDGQADAGRRRCGAHRGGRFGPLGDAIHGELVVPEPPEEGEEGDEGDAEGARTFETVVLDAGEVTAVDDDSLTLERPDGESVTVRITDDTKMREAPEEGDHVRVIADDDGNARAILARPERADRPERDERRAQAERVRGTAQGRPCGPGAQGRRPGGRGPAPGAPESTSEEILLDQV